MLVNLLSEAANEKRVKSRALRFWGNICLTTAFFGALLCYVQYRSTKAEIARIAAKVSSLEPQRLTRAKINQAQ